METKGDHTYLILNAGTQTRKAFIAGLEGASYRSLKTKRMALHIDARGSIAFVYRNAPIDLTNTTVFTRLRATDQHFCGILYEHLAHRGIPANDPIQRSFKNSGEKITQMLLLAQQNIPIPESFIFREESFEANRAYIEARLVYPCIYKRDGSQGEHVHLVTSREMLAEHIEAKPPYELALVQPFIENTFDTRTIVAYGEILGTISRTRTSGFRNNIAQGAHAAIYTLTDAEQDLAVRAARACRIDIAGVDMLHTPHGPVVLEVNKSPQIHGFESVHDFKVFTKVAHILSQNKSSK